MKNSIKNFRKYGLSISLFVLFVFTFIILSGYSGCKKEDSNPVTPTNPTTGENAVQTYTSTTGGSISVPSGYAMDVLPGVVPTLSSGNPGTVAFSIETSVTAPVAYTEYPIVGSVVKLGPEGFNFARPIRLWFPASTQSSAVGLYIYYYFADSNKWGRLNTSIIDTVSKKIGTDALKLGYYALVKTPETTDGAPDSQGGFKYPGSMDIYNHYTVTVMNVTLKYAYQASWFPGGLIGYTFASGSGPTGGSAINPIYGHLPQGNYTLCISRATYSGLTLGPTYTNDQYVTVNIQSPLTYWGWGNAQGFVEVSSPGGNWVQNTATNPPCNWPVPTTPYGTGVFQATLNWYNGSSTITDLDLYLITPGNDSIWYGHKQNAYFQLDRDWTVSTGAGNAVENIYSLQNTIPSGSYTVRVKFFSGYSPKSYSVRVIRSGSVTNYSGTLSSGGVANIVTFSVQ